MEALRASGTNIQALAENGVEIFFTQVFRHNFFHADMHPGNIFVIVDDPERPKYAAVDFGIVGTLSPSDQKYLAGNFLAFFERDYHEIAKLHLDSGWVPPDTRIDQLETAIRTICEPIFNKPLAEISFAQILLRLFRISQQFNMEIQPQLILLQKTLLNIEGLGRELYPELDLWKTAYPILRQWMDEQVGPRAILDDIRVNLPQLREALRKLPVVIKHLAYQATEGNLQATTQALELKVLREQFKRQQRHFCMFAVGATAALSGTLILILGTIPILGWILLVAGIVSLIGSRLPS